MQPPFSHDAFLDVFAAYNATWWPVALLLWAATAVVAWRWLRGPGVGGRLLMALLGVHWAWSGVVYHWGFFRDVNPAASLFAAGFVAQAFLFAALAVKAREQVRRPGGARGAVAAGLVICGLVYPALGVGFGLAYPRLPLFGVPCPTTLVTAGFLLAAPRVPRRTLVVPILWAAVGSSAAILLGMTADLALVVAGVVLVVDAAMPSALGPRVA